jgi:hypothetical protein
MEYFSVIETMLQRVGGLAGNQPGKNLMVFTYVTSLIITDKALNYCYVTPCFGIELSISAGNAFLRTNNLPELWNIPAYFSAWFGGTRVNSLSGPDHNFRDLFALIPEKDLNLISNNCLSEYVWKQTPPFEISTVFIDFCESGRRTGTDKRLPLQRALQRISR